MSKIYTVRPSRRNIAGPDDVPEYGYSVEIGLAPSKESALAGRISLSAICFPTYRACLLAATRVADALMRAGIDCQMDDEAGH